MDHQQELQQVLERAVAFEEIQNSKGFQLIKSYYENKIQALTNGLLLSDKPIGEFETERTKLRGIQELFAHITNDIETLYNERQKEK
jgi:hypothetical protein